ncbi:hypothetical protein Poly30_42140 [Planctomycetes bacterium Poly30]|uniref:Uncharacterized protein n=1 Tax=Saltatorellus ferox TaxID=2528018 RepID=A0A518EX73_9BACT|nr:hypothetical protein Poly30_42140 [Planctomycetes bacterium Poly30]
MLTRLFFATSGALILAGSSAAQGRYFFSVDWQSPLVGAADPFTTIPMTEGDMLRPQTITSRPMLGPLPTPNVTWNHDTNLGLPPICIGHPGGTPCIVEVDAFSTGADRPFPPNLEIEPGQILFSVDEFARGFGGGPLPNVRSEAMAREAAADVFTTIQNMPPGPVGAFSPGRNIGVIDGDGLPSTSGYAYPGVGLREPIMVNASPFETGDNKDAIEYADATFSGLYYSLDAGFVDPLEGLAHSGSAAANGFVGGDVLRATAIGVPAVYAPAIALGLDLVGGPDSDDLDALILWDNGNGVYDPSFGLYDWVTGGSDMLLFSVRRGSAIIGQPDSHFGMPIEEGDILMPPPMGGGAFLPGIFVPAEQLGLLTRRSSSLPHGDDLNALDSLNQTLLDCNGNGIEDAVDIAIGTALDANMNGVPDSCEAPVVIGTPFCFCPLPSSPCGNASPTTGCLNVASTGAFMTGSGSTSVGLDNLVLTTAGMVPGTFAITFMGPGSVPPVTVGNGLLCLAGPLYRFPPFSTGAGTGSVGGGLAAYTVANNPPPGHILPGSSWNFQTFYRDIGGPCGSNFNLSSALAVTFTP